MPAVIPIDNRYRDRVIQHVNLLYTAVASAFGPPSAPVPTTLTTGGTVLAGVYGVKVSYVNGAGETVGSAAGTVTTTGTTSTITVPSPNPAYGVTGWYAYFTQVNGSSYTLQQSPGVPVAIGTPFTITAPPSSGGTAPLSSSTAGNAPSIAKVELDTRAVTFDETVTTLRTEGTNTTYETDSTDRVQFAVDQSVFQGALEQIAMNFSTLTTGVARRSWYSGDAPAAYYGLELIYHAVDITSGAAVSFVNTAPKCTVRRYNPLQGGATRKVVTPQQIILLAIRTTTDLLGVPLDAGSGGTLTIPVGGVYVYFDKLSTALAS